jgi:hypothetical protein
LALVMRSKNATLGPRLKHLRERGLTERRYGERSGESIAAAGLAVLASAPV